MLFPFRTVVFKQNFNQGRISQNQLDDQNREGSVQVQCFPIFSILAALNQTRVDYFSLDIEGDELAVLKTIPWNNVHIQVIFDTKCSASRAETHLMFSFTDLISGIHP